MGTEMEAIGFCDGAANLPLLLCLYNSPCSLSPLLWFPHMRFREGLSKPPSPEQHREGQAGPSRA